MDENQKIPGEKIALIEEYLPGDNTYEENNAIRATAVGDIQLDTNERLASINPQKQISYAGVLKLFLERIRDKLPPKINGDGTQFRDFVYVEDVANANIMSMDSDINHEFFNVGTNTSITILDLAKTIIKSSGLDMEPIFGPPLKGDVQRTIANIDLIKEKIGWTPTVTLEEWIDKIISTNKFDEI